MPRPAPAPSKPRYPRRLRSIDIRHGKNPPIVILVNIASALPMFFVSCRTGYATSSTASPMNVSDRLMKMKNWISGWNALK